MSVLALYCLQKISLICQLSSNCPLKWLSFFFFFLEVGDEDGGDERRGEWSKDLEKNTEDLEKVWQMQQGVNLTGMNIM